MSAIVKQTSEAGALVFTPEQEKMILSAFLGGATREEAAVLMEVAKIRRLNPLLKQIHFVKRWDNQKREEVWAYQTSIEGLRTIAERTGRYEGQTKPEWCGPDGIWRDVWLEDAPPAAARVGVYKQGFREPLYGIARWKSYVQTKRDGTVTQFWARMSDLMLSKCAEAIALRKAFPEDVGDLYVAEEMQDERPEPQAPPRAAPVPAAQQTVEAKKEEPNGRSPADALRESIRSCPTLQELATMLPKIRLVPQAEQAGIRETYNARKAELQKRAEQNIDDAASVLGGDHAAA